MPNPSFTPNLNLVLPATGTRGWDALVNATCTTLDGLAPLGSLAVTPADVDPVLGTSTSLNIKVAAGTFRKSDGTAVAFAGAPTTAVTASQLSYVYLDDSGNLNVAPGGFPAAANVVPLAVVNAGPAALVRITDQRAPFFSFGAPAGATGTTTGTAAAHAVYAGPSAGAAAAPSFRALAAADLPPLDASAVATGTFATALLPAFAGSGAGHAPGVVPDAGATAGTSRYLREDGSWTVPASAAGGVAAVTLNTPDVLYATPVNFNVAAGVATGTLALNSQAPGTVLAGPVAGGAAAAPTFRALAGTDLPDLSALYCNLTGDQTISGPKTFAQTITGSVSGTAGTITGAITESQVMNLVSDLAAKQSHSDALDALSAAAYPAGALLGGQASGLPCPVAVGAGLTLANGTLSATGTAGAIAESQVTNLVSDLASKQAHSAALDALTAATYPAGALLGGQANGLPAPIAVGAGLTLANGTLSATGGAASPAVSVGLTMPAGFTVGGSPVTGSGTLAVSTALSGLVKANGSGFVAASAGTDYLAPGGNGSTLVGLNASSIATGTVPAANLPVMGASGPSHAAGIVPDPGANPGTTRFLCENGMWVAPTYTSPSTPTGPGTIVTAERARTAPAVTGSRSGNAALHSLLAALAALGLVVDETTD